MGSFPLSFIRDLYQHMEWADASVWKGALAGEAARRDEALRATLGHLHGVQQAFLDAWTGRPISFDDASASTDLVQLHESAKRYYPSVRDYLGRLQQHQLDSEFVMPWVHEYEAQLGRKFAPTTLGETLYQVIAHTNHHRGQVNTRLRALGGEPPLVDYIVWIQFGRLPAEWPSLTL